ncbi:hypothetical protein [Marixanthomonas ophiurae]|uniref:Signal peptidase n=1 Tax=Marixanthomonas ophiurae TaxID=387659 RepID=A0A3E1QAR4_9FLAO|nr:hypothetical protein [Marixanthomonas ophiurae]RFN59217.1 hypothetical protein DZ858_03860 [Marixanthomonas ophiurae]
MRSRIIFILTIALSFYNSALSLGQSLAETSSGPPPPNEGGGTMNGPEFPIDDNIFILVGLGLALGIYFFIKKYRSNDIPA